MTLAITKPCGCVVATGPRSMWAYLEEWARSVIAQCNAGSVACFVKQFGANVRWNGIQGGYMDGMPNVWPDGVTWEDSREGDFRVLLSDRKGGDMAEWPEDLRVREMPEERN